MTPELKAAVKSACVQAVKSLGDNYKGMSCLLFNWRQKRRLYIFPVPCFGIVIELRGEP